MVNQLSLFISIATSVFFLTIVAMVYARRFQGNARSESNERPSTTASVVSLRQSASHRRRRGIQFRPSNRPTKPYNTFTKDELHLLHQTTLTQADLDAIGANNSAVPTTTTTKKNPTSENNGRDHAKSVESAELGILRYASLECSICLALYEANDSVRVLSCNHVFHCVCVDVWLTDRSACCPICKTDNRSSLGLEFRKHGEEETPTSHVEIPSPNRHHVVDITPPPPIALL